MTKEILRVMTEGDPQDDSCAAGVKANQTELKGTRLSQQRFLPEDDIISRKPTMSDCIETRFTQFEE